MKPCRYCQTPFTPPPKRGLPIAFCSDDCRKRHRRIRDTENERRRRRARKVARLCANPYCGQEFKDDHRWKFCSKVCGVVGNAVLRQGIQSGQTAAIRAGQLIACRVYFGNCQHCGEPRATPNRGMLSRLSCSACRARIQRDSDRKKNHSRRAAGRMTMTVDDLAIRDGTRCYVCHRKVDMSLSGQAKWGPTIEHIVPVSKGGTNDPANLALSHRCCNTARGNRGHAQLQLIG